MSLESLVRALAVTSCIALPCAATGCGGGGDICEVEFASIAGTYTFTLEMHDVRWLNTCFSNGEPSPPTSKTDCTWAPDENVDSFTIEFVIEDDGDIGSARITDTSGDADDDLAGFEVECEMLEGEICDAPIRCRFREPDGCSALTPEPDEWTYNCGCDSASGLDPNGPECQACKAEFDKYASERDEFCDKGREGDFFEFTLSVN
jgi:hypothetical protein